MATKLVQAELGAVAQLGMGGVEQEKAPGLVLTDSPRPHPNPPQNSPQPAEQGLLPCPLC